MRKAWEWVKRHWELLVGGLLVVLGFLFGLSLRRRPSVVSSKSPAQKSAEEEAAKEISDIHRKAEEKKQELEKEHADSLAAVVRVEQEAAPQLVNDPDATNEFLKQVGDLVRGGDGGRKQ